MQLKKCVLSIVLVLTLVFSMTSIQPPKAAYAEVVPPPEGTIGIYTAQDLSDMRNNLSGSYTLMNDIDLSAFTSSGDGWVPVGTQDAPFTGTLNGNGYSITGLRIYKHYLNTTSFVGGLFGYGNGMTVKNLNLTAIFDVTVARANRYTYLGGVVGYANTVSISGCTLNLKAKGKAESVRIGGFVGKAVSPNSVETEITSVSGCVMSGEINASARSYLLGGAIGEGISVSIADCENKVNLYGLVTAPGWISSAGGLCGAADTDDINNCINNGKVTIDNAISSPSMPAKAYGAGILGEYYYGDDVSSNPTTSINNCTNNAAIASKGTGPAELAGIAGTLFNATVSGCTNFGIIQHSPLAYDGYSSGIVGSNSNGKIEHCDNYGAVVNMVTVAAGITSESYGDISNCENHGNLRGNTVVGIVLNSVGNVTDCRNTGQLTSCKSATGICYTNKKGEISRCVNSGSINASADASGIVWSNQDYVHDCYNIGLIKGADAGGICGDNEGWALIDNCYNLGGLAIGAKGKAGGIAIHNSATITQSYYLDTISKGVSTSSVYSIDASTKITASQLKSQSTYVGFDFTEDETPAVWKMSSTSGLPMLKGSDEVYIKSVSLVRKPLQVVYLVNNPISTKGAWLEVDYSDGNKVYLDHGFTVSPYTKTIGSHTIYLNYGGQKVSYPVTFNNINLSIFDSEAIEVSWGPISGATTVKVYMATSAAGPYKFVTTADTQPSGGYQRIYWPDFGQVYYYKIRPMYGSTPGAVSGYASIRFKPNTPKNIMIYRDQDGLQVNWDGTINAEHYELYCSKTLEGPYTKIASTFEYPSYTHKGLQQGATYYYAVRSYVVSNGVKVYGNFSEVVAGTYL